MTANKQLLSLLKTKGTGAAMGKSLSTSDIETLETIFQTPKVNHTTLATLITALLMLPPTEDEKGLIDKLNKNAFSPLPNNLQNFFNQSQKTVFRTLCYRLMEGKNLTEPELQTGLHSVLDSNIEDFEKAVFLEALRLKRETLEENKACLRFLQSRIQRTPLQTPGLIQISDPFDGYNRHPHLSLFVSVILGSIGLPTLIHGIKEVSPKRGITPHKLLVNAKKRPIITIKETEEQLMTPHIGWAYLDQSSYLPELAELVPLRQAMLKRPLLSTIEKFCCPFSTPNTLLVTGYTHPPYKKMMTSLFLETLPTQSMLLLRGIEGSTHLPLDRRAPYMFCTASDTKEDFCRPSQLNFPETDTIQDTEITEKQSLTQGIQALSGKESPLQSSLIYTASMIAHFHTQKPLTDLRKIISETILSGKALSHWEKGQC